MRVEGDQVAEGLDVEHEAGFAAGVEDLVALDQQFGHQLTESAEAGAVVTKPGSQQLGQGKDILTVGDGGEDVFFHPFPIGEHAFLVATGAEVTGFAGKCQEVVVAAIVTVDPGDVNHRNPGTGPGPALLPGG